MTSKLVVNTIEADTGISSVSFASSISLSSTSKFFFSDAGINIGPDTNINRPATGVLGFNINSGEKVRITSAGYVGIGLANPTYKLHVYGGNVRFAQPAGTDITLDLQEATTSNPFRFKQTATEASIQTFASQPFNIRSQAGSGSTSYLAFWTRDNERLRITPEGSVGIGITNPNDTVHVYHATDNYVARFESGDAGGGIVLKDNTHATTLLSNNGAFEIDVDNGGDLSSGESIAFKISGSEKLRITSSGQFLMGATSSDSTNKMLVQGSGTTILRVNNTDDGTAQLTLSNTGSSNGQIKQISGHMTFSIAGDEKVRINSSGHVLPGSNNTYDLGSSSLRWRDIYTNDLHLSNKNSTNSIDNTWGDYTIQEGESDLFLINNRSGKKYKFNLTEVT